MSSCCQSKENKNQPGLSDQLKIYRPVVTIGLLSLILAVALSASNTMPFMNGFMGMALILLAFLKLLGPEKFASIFRQYDPAAKRMAVYADIYPYLEAGLGVLFLAGYFPVFANVVLVIIFSINTIGVMQVIKSGAKVQCGCVGAAFALPVGRVTLAENILMIVMGMIGIGEWIIL